MRPGNEDDSAEETVMDLVTMEEAMNLLNRDDRFKATVAAMNTLLIRKGIYTQEEFEGYFIESATSTVRKNVPRQCFTSGGGERV
jgi:hypothetical protein